VAPVKQEEQFEAEERQFRQEEEQGWQKLLKR
jgi:hypothetical protein